jgi:rod shape-determining protein MreC
MPGASQNTAKTLIACLVLFCAAMGLTAYTRQRPAAARFGSALMIELLRPLQSTHGFMRHGVSGVWDSYLGLVRTQRDNLNLRERLAVLETQNSQLMELAKENIRLRGLLRMAQGLKSMQVAANVIGYDPSNWVQVITIDKGKRDGVEIEMAVLEGNGVVGQVIAAGLKSARVLLLTDHTSGIDAIVQESRARGVLEGLGRFRCKLSYVPVQEEVEVGDRVITSGMDGIFPKGLVLGIVSSVGEKESGKLFQDLEVKSSVDFSKLETVLVVTAQKRQE